MGVEEVAAETAAKRGSGTLPPPRPQLHHYRQQGLPVWGTRQRLRGKSIGTPHVLDLDVDIISENNLVTMTWWPEMTDYRNRTVDSTEPLTGTQCFGSGFVFYGSGSWIFF